MKGELNIGPKYEFTGEAKTYENIGKTENITMKDITSLINDINHSNLLEEEIEFDEKYTSFSLNLSDAPGSCCSIECDLDFENNTFKCGLYLSYEYFEDLYDDEDKDIDDIISEIESDCEYTSNNLNEYLDKLNLVIIHLVDNYYFNTDLFEICDLITKFINETN